MSDDEAEKAAREDSARELLPTEEVSLSVAATNALRISLGLKPLQESPTSAESTAEANYARHREAEAGQVRVTQLRAKLDKAKEKRAAAVKLVGASLGAASGDDGDSALAWIASHRTTSLSTSDKKPKKVKRDKKDKKFSELDGLRVAHSVDDFEEGDQRILVLRDKSITDLETHGDDLENVDMVQHQKDRKLLEAQSAVKRAASSSKYYANDDPFDSTSLLSKYDDDNDKQSFFVLGATGSVSVDSKPDAPSTDNTGANTSGGAVSLDFDKMRAIHDYYTTDEIKIKKPKKKSTRKRIPDPIIPSSSAVPSIPTSTSTPQAYEFSNKLKQTDHENFVDDDDLQAALARTRRVRVADDRGMKRQEEAVKDLLTSTRSVETLNEAVTDNKDGLVISEMAEFVRNLPTTSIIDEIQERERENTRREGEAAAEWRQNREREADQTNLLDIKKETSDGEDYDMDFKSEDTTSTPNLTKDDLALLDEPLVGSSLSATMNLLTSKGLIDRIDIDASDRERIQRNRAKWNVDRKRIDLDREKTLKDRRQKNLKYDDDEYEVQKRKRVQQDVDKFRNYKPDVNLSYADEYGRELNAKEAFKQLSHTFHGKYSGKTKSEKKLKKMEEELKMQKLMSSDVPNSSSAMDKLYERTKINGTGFVVLSVGSRGGMDMSGVVGSGGRDESGAFLGKRKVVDEGGTETEKGKDSGSLSGVAKKR